MPVVLSFNFGAKVQKIAHHSHNYPKSLEVWKNVLIFAVVKYNKVKIKSYNAYKYHSAEY